MPNNHQPATKSHSILMYIVLGASFLVFIQTFRLLAPILLSFLLIFLISLSFNPVISRMLALTGGRKKATGLIVATLLMGLSLAGWASFGTLQDSAIKVSEQLPAYWERLQKPLIKMEQEAALTEEKLQLEVTTEIERSEEVKENGQPDTDEKLKSEATTETTRTAAVEGESQPETDKSTEDEASLRSSLSQMLQGVVGGFTEVAFNAAQILIVLVTVAFGVIFTLTNPRPIFQTLFSLVPERHHDQTLVIMQRIVNFVPGWAGATLLGMITVGFLVFLLMWPIFGFQDALVLGLIAFILEVIPFLGPLLSAVAAMLLAVGQGGMAPLWVLLAYIAVQTFESNVVFPFVMARSMTLNPVAVIFSMLLCVAAFGVLGVLVAAPLVAILVIMHEELYRKRFLPTVTDEDLDLLARKALDEKTL